MASGSSSFSTRYSELSGAELGGLFTTDTWNSLNGEQRLAACQEVENRYAAETGHAPIQVSAVPMTDSIEDGYTWGYQLGNHLYLNLDVLESGQFRLSDQDEKGNDIITAVNAPAPNWNMLDTIFHEATHGFQYQDGRQSYTYINFETDSDLYRIQPDEAEAFREGNTRTIQTLLQQMDLTGKVDPNAQAYLDAVKANSYQAALQEAAKNYNDSHIDQTLAQFIYDRDHNIQQKEPSSSYQAISKAYDQARGAHFQQTNNPQKENDRTSPVSPDPAHDPSSPNGGRQSNDGHRDDRSQQNEDHHQDGNSQQGDSSQLNSDGYHGDGDHPDDGGSRQNDDGQQNDNSYHGDGDYPDDGGRQSERGSYQDDGGYQGNGGSYQDDDGYQGNGGSYQDDGGYQSDGGSYQDDGGYQSDGGSYQDDGGYQSDGGSYQDDGGYQSDGGSYQDDGSSYQDGGGYDSGSDGGGSDRDGGMDND